ncbi:MAG: undecaprenyl-diphosphate phosphatase [Candidatus Hodarchaeales archaeon]|jgi:undecaprenyl-diphosphatase
MVDIFQGILMAIFQGIIEWLPISSEGQLSLLFINIFQITELEAVTLALILHIGTMISVLWYFRQDFINMFDINAPITRMVLFSTLGTAITAVPIILIFKRYWETLILELNIDPGILFTILIGILLILTGLILANQPKQGTLEISALSQKEIIKFGLIIGLAQGFAALPGISRSGMTITALLLLGFTQRESLRISFIISVPAVLGATILEFLLEGFYIKRNGIAIGSIEFPYLLLFFTILLTALVGILTMNGLMKLKDLPYDKFCIGFGILTITFGLLMYIISLI